MSVRAQREKLRRSDERGVVIVLVAIWLPVLALFAMFAIDVAHWYDYSRNLQTRADAAALAAGAQYGNTCIPATPDPAAMKTIGEYAQLYSGPGPSSDLPYPYSGLGSPLADIAGSQYENFPGLKAGTLDKFHVRLNDTDYWPAAAVTMGTYCDATDENGRTGAITDVRLVQDHLPLFIPLLGIQPNIRAHARVEIQRLLQANNIRPLAVRDPSATPCLTVNFVQTNGSDPNTPQTQSIALTAEAPDPTNPGGPIIWDNGAGSTVKVPAGANLYMQVFPNNCGSPPNGVDYESTSGVDYVNSYQPSVSTAPGFMDPNADGAISDWTKLVGTQAWSLLDDGIRQPAVPNLGLDRIQSLTTPQRQDLAFPNGALTWKSGDTYKLWVYGNTSGEVKRVIQDSISTNEGASFSPSPNGDLFAANTAATWKSDDISGFITSQAALDGLRVRLIHADQSGGTPTGTATVGAVYIERTPAGPGPRIVGSASTGDGVTLATNGVCAPDQYFSTNSGCEVSARALVDFDADATGRTLTVVDTKTGRSVNLVNSSGNVWSWPTGTALFAIAALSGQHQFRLNWTETSATRCGVSGGNPRTCNGSFGIQQQAYAACNSSVGANTCADPDDSGPIVLAQLSEGLNQNVNSLSAGTHTIGVKVELQGLASDVPGDGTPSRVLRFATSTDQQTGLIDCGQGSGAQADSDAITNGCPIVGSADCNVPDLCAPLKINQRAGICDPPNRQINPDNAADCVTTTQGLRRNKIPGAIASIVVKNGICAENQWNYPGGPPADDPRKLLFIITSPADLSGQTGPVTVPIRNFATFYVTGWDTQANPKCATVANGGTGNDPYPGGGGGNADNGAIWGHWLTNTDPDGGGSGVLCDFKSFGDCVAVLSR
jgi:putative Flp pilus-assembly TadE/G-like protein